MKVLLLQPPVRDFYETEMRLQPMGLCMLRAAAESALPGVRVTVKDFHKGFGRRTVRLPAELRYLKDYYALPDGGPFSTFREFFHFGAGFEEIGRAVAREGPDLVGISCLFTPYYREALACAREIRRHSRAPILMGGPHVSAAPLTVLMDPAVDFIIRGEGERPFVIFLKALMNGSDFEGVHNLGFKREGRPVLNPMEDNLPFQELPLPDLSDLSVDKYTLDKKPLCFITTSRGCPHRCAFCAVHLTFGRKYRRRTNESVISEMRLRYGQGYRAFDFEDDNLSHDSAAFKGLLEGIIPAFPEGGIRLAAMNGFSYLNLDREALELMKQAGFRDLNISLVSAREETHAQLGRPHRMEKFLEVVGDAHDLGLNIVAYQILGLPNETLEDMIETMALLARLPVLIGPSVFYLTPGCALAASFPEWTEADLVRARSTAMAIETENFRREDLYTLFIAARTFNFLKGLNADERTVGVWDAVNEAGERGRRAQAGKEILRRLFAERRLYAATPQGFRAVDRFRPALFFELWSRVQYICRQAGAKLTLR